MSGNGTKLSRYERDYLKQLVLECDVQRFGSRESLAYIHAKLGKPISHGYLIVVKRNLRRSLAGKLDYYRKHRTAYIEQFFRRIAEIEKYQQALWNDYHVNAHMPRVRREIITELHQLTITLANLYEVLPAFTSGPIAADLPLHNEVNAGLTVTASTRGPSETESSARDSTADSNPT